MDINKNEILSRNKELRNIHDKERCFILACGPSINNQNLKFLKGEKCIAVSRFYLHPDFQIINPAYYCIAPYHLPISEVGWQNLMKDIEKNVTSSMFFSMSDYVRNQKKNMFLSHKKYFIDFSNNSNINSLISSKCELSKPLLPIQNVIHMALYVAIFMGFKEIVLLGCDHDWILHLNKSRHFYKEKDDVLVKNGYNEWLLAEQDLESHFRSYVRVWQIYKAIKVIADRNKISILNATEGGLLDVFKRVDYANFFKKKIKNPVLLKKSKSYQRHINPHILSMVDSKPPGRILEIGCAEGFLGKTIKEKYVCEYIGVEINSESCKIAKKQLDRVIDADIQQKSLKDFDVCEEYFDYIIYNNILENLSDPWTALYQHTDFLKDDGFIIASISNVRNFEIIQSLIVGNRIYKNEGRLDATHLKFFTFQEIRKMFDSCCLEIKEVRNDVQHFFDIDKIPENAKINIELPKVIFKEVTKQDVIEFSTMQFVVKAQKNLDKT